MGAVSKSKAAGGVIDAGVLTRDLGGAATTEDVTAALVAALREAATSEHLEKADVVPQH